MSIYYIYTLTINQRQTNIKLKLGIETEKNYVGLIQEYAQKNKFDLPVYEIKEKDGQFRCKCTFLNHEVISDEKNKKCKKYICKNENIFN